MRSWIRMIGIGVWLIAAAACGGDVVAKDAAPEATEVTSAGGRATGGRYTLDFQVGHANDQGKSSGGTVKLKAGAAVTR